MGKMGKNRKKMRGPGKGQWKEKDEGKGVRLNYESTVKENLNYEKYYKIQKVCPEEEWDEMMTTLKTSLPTSFRITGSKAESKVMLDIIENRLIKDAYLAAKDDGQDIKSFPIPWYPNKLAWQLNLTRNDIRRNEAYLRLHNFLISETESGNINRQEAVSMIPPLALKVEPHHKVFDMCASPGSKTAQIIEMLHSGDGADPPTGYVVANDVDNKRCYMLVHQGKRLQSPAFIVTNHDASQFPNVFITDDTSVNGKKKMKFDRVLCDVPCSGDGTIRKNVDVWKKWSPSNGLYLHQLQHQILRRGLELLEVGGLLVYSTCSLNPIEDEAVIFRAIKESEGAVELRDIDLPHLKHRKGLFTWKVCNRDLEFYDTPKEIATRWVTTIRPYVFPPTEEEAKAAHLDKCIRVLPHQQDTGGFFIALLTKTKSLPSESLAVPISSGDALNIVEEPKRSKPPPKKKAKMYQGFKEDPFVFMQDDHPIWPNIRDFYQLDGKLDSTHFLRRTTEGKIKNLYLTTKSVRDFVQCNDSSVKIINVGVKTLARIDNKWSPCEFRLSQEGLPSLFPHVHGRKITVTKDDLIMMLHQKEDEKAPVMDLFSDYTKEQVSKIDRGSLVLVADVEVDDESPRCRLELVGWKGHNSLRVYIQRNERMHYLRLCGVNVSQYEVNKFKDKDASPSEATDEIEIEITADKVETGETEVDQDTKLASN